MKNTIQTSIATLILSIGTAGAAPLNVPGTADPWLAGMPDGTGASTGGGAPANSPVFAAAAAGGQIYTFSASGSVAQGPGDLIWGPDGNTSYGIVTTDEGGSYNIAGLTGPIDALVGVFLGSSLPTANPTPAALDFSSQASRDYLSLSPALQQPFFIGDGLTSSAAIQQIVAPAGATRLYLGVLDWYTWPDNIGSYDVNLQAVPEPNSLCLGVLGLTLGVLKRSLKRNVPAGSSTK